MHFLLFLGQVFVISMSGAMQPGPVTATVITMGTRNRWAGILMTAGHILVEAPLILLLLVGLGEILKLPASRVIIGLLGGTFLIILGIQTYFSSRHPDPASATPVGRGPLMAGIILSATNPYFLIWWATVGLTLATRAWGFGAWALLLFAAVHWLVDLVWLQALSWTSYKGSRLLGPKALRVILLFFAVALLLLGIYFLIDSALILLR